MPVNILTLSGQIFRAFTMRIRFAAPALIMLGIASCGPAPPDIVQLDVITDSRNEIYDFREFDYDYARAEALPRTNLEPAPTSYALFSTAKLKTPITDIRKEELEQLTKLIKEQNDRVNAYCLVHYELFESLTTAYEKDIFGNVVTFYWPIKTKEVDAISILTNSAATIPEKCKFLTDRYDYDRADALLDSLGPNGEFKNAKGPVMVLDLGFDAVVVPMDNVTKENMARIPPIWKQSMDDALKTAVLSRRDAIKELEKLDKEIAEDEAKAADKDVKKGARKKARESADANKTKKKSLLKRLFGKNSWGRAIACGFSKVVMTAAGAIIPSTELLEAKAKSWCSSD